MWVMRRTRSLHHGGWVVICLFLLQGAGFSLYPHSASAGSHYFPFRFVLQQAKAQMASQNTTAPDSDSTPLHFQESFASHHYLAYNVGTRWNIASQQLALQLQDNVGQQDVVVA